MPSAIFVLLFAAAWVSAAAKGQTCGALHAIEPGDAGLNGQAHTFVEFDDDGPGPSPRRLYAMGTFNQAGQVQTPNGLARWNGESWEAVPGPVSNFPGTMCIHRDGDQEILCVGQTQLHRFDGKGWTTEPIPFYLGIPGGVVQMVSMDPDGAGPEEPELYVAVSYLVFHELGPSVLVYRYDQGNWTPSTGAHAFFDGGMSSMIAYDRDGDGPAAPELYCATNYFDEYPWGGGGRSSGVYRLDGQQWRLVGVNHGDGMMVGGFWHLAVHDPDGDGPLTPRLYVGGRFDYMASSGQGSLPAQSIAAWDGERWWEDAQGIDGVTALASYDPDGSGPGPPMLVAGGWLPVGSVNFRLAYFDGNAWHKFGDITLGSLSAMLAFEEHGAGGPGRSLAVSGSITQLGGLPARNFGVWRGGHWAGVAARPVGAVNSLVLFNDGAGQRLFALGEFDRIGADPAFNIAKWEGDAWRAITPGIEANSAIPHPKVHAAAVHNDGSGWALYIGGSFASAGGQYVHNIAKWNGQSWSRVGQYGLHGGPVRALEVHDPDGAGPLPPLLYAGGAFTMTDGGAPARHIAAWDGAAWSEPAGGTTGEVRALRSWNGSLYVGGVAMSPGGVPPNTVARLDGSGWAALPPAGNAGSVVNAFGVHDEGGGFRLHAAGLFRFGPGTMGQCSVVRLDGASWTPLNQPSHIEALSLRSSEVNGEVSLLMGDESMLWRLTNGAWLPFSAQASGPVRAITHAFDDGRGRSIFVARDAPANLGGLSQVHRIPVCQPCYANCDQSAVPPVLNVNDFVCFQQRFAAGDPRANCDESTAQPVLNVNDFVCFQQRFAGGCG